MTISKTAISILLLSVLMLASIDVWRTSERSAASSIALPTNVVSPTPPASDLAAGADTGKSISAKSISGTSANSQNKANSDLMDREINLVWRKLVRSTGLPYLERIKLAPDDIEIRVWDLPGLYIGKTKCWVFSRKDGQWKAVIFVDPEFNGRIITKPLDTPSMGWRKWDAYVNSDITPAKIRERRPEPAPENDAMEIVVEVKLGDDYARDLVVAGDDLLVKLFKTIKTEFFNDDQVKWSKI